MSDYEDSILAQFSSPGLKRNSLETKESLSGNDKPNIERRDPNIESLEPPRSIAEGGVPEGNAAAAEPQRDSAPAALRPLARCLGCGEDLFDSHDAGGWHRGIRHRDGTWICGLVDRPSPGVEAAD